MVYLSAVAVWYDMADICSFFEELLLPVRVEFINGYFFMKPF